MKITIPELALVVLIGPSGSGKSTFARTHFKPTEVLSSDACRGLVSDDENDQGATNDAFAVLHFIAARRLGAGRLTLVDATNVQEEARKPLVALAREQNVLPVAIVFDLPEKVCHRRNESRPDRRFGPHVVRGQSRELRRSLRNLGKEGFRHIFVLGTEEEVAAATVERQPLWNDRRSDHGPFDIIGDIHGCFEELQDLVSELGYVLTPPADPLSGFGVSHPESRKLVFLGDLVDRGPRTPDVLRLVMGAVESGAGLCVPGNHDTKLLRKLRGKDVRITHGLAESLAQLDAEPPAFHERIATFIDGLVSHYVLDDGKLVVAHAGLKAELQGRASGRVREFCLFGETTGETDEYGLPIRHDWAAGYRGKAMVVYGHTPVFEPEWLNGTINIDTGCVFGGRLTALRYPERELVSVPALQTWYEPAKPFLPESHQAPPLTAQQQLDDLLSLDDVLGKRLVSTRLHRSVTIRESHARAALEVMSRFAADPRWLVYLPPTMSPCATSPRDGLLEHPDEAFAYFRHEGIPRVLCEEKHMGSRAVVIVCRSGDAARRAFGVSPAESGIVLTRTGRKFFDDEALETALLDRLRAAIGAAGLWDELKSDWLILDAELMPWSAKARQLLRNQYANVGAAATAALPVAVDLLSRCTSVDEALVDVRERFAARAGLGDRFVAAYRRYCWTVNGLDDLKLAPFHLLASEGRVHVDSPHDEHMTLLARLAERDPRLLLATRHLLVDVTDPASVEAGTRFWEDLVGPGGEGMVVKPLSFVAKGARGLVQPAVKVRGPEYLRIIYGPEYTLPDNLSRLKRRGLAGKRSLALREFALGIEALERFVRKEPLRRVHECVFGVLALESEPVDPRL